MTQAGYVPVPLSGEDHIEPLSAEWRAVNGFIPVHLAGQAASGAGRRASRGGEPIPPARYGRVCALAGLAPDLRAGRELYPALVGPVTRCELRYRAERRCQGCAVRYASPLQARSPLRVWYRRPPRGPSLPRRLPSGGSARRPRMRRPRSQPPPRRRPACASAAAAAERDRCGARHQTGARRPWARCCLAGPAWLARPEARPTHGSPRHGAWQLL